MKYIFCYVGRVKIFRIFLPLLKIFSSMACDDFPPLESDKVDNSEFLLFAIIY